MSNNQPSTGSHHNATSTSPSTALTVGNNQDSSSIKTVQRRKKGPGHRRNNSKGSTTSWAPPSLSTIADQEKKRASINVTVNQIFDPSIESKSPLPTISADIDSKSNTNNRRLNPKNLKLDLQNHSTTTQLSPTNQQRPSTIFTYAPRKSSSSDPEDLDANQHHNLTRQRRRRLLNQSNTKTSSPSSTRSVKSISFDQNTPLAEEFDHERNSIEDRHDHEKGSDLRKYPRSVSFQNVPPTTTDRSPSYHSRTSFNRVITNRSLHFYIIYKYFFLE